MPPPTPLPFVGQAFIQLMRQHRYLLEQGLGKLGLHVGQEMILFQLWQKDGVTQSEISGCIEVSAPTVTKMLQGLEANGIILRQPDPHDARSLRVYLTEKGQALEPAVCALWQDTEAQMLHGVNEAERLLLLRLLDQMRENLSKNPK
ncbi:MAG: MarR family winged helix-turn-helix transcriptional regulator [Phototrophicaceae bacterium]|jgi:DNA-binding MarR family transcriptional regulator